MQSRSSIAAYCIAVCLGFVGSIAAQEAAVAPSGDCGCGQQGGYSVEGCLKGWEIRQNDAEGLWNGYCEGDCRVGHAKDRMHCGKRSGDCGQSGCGTCGGLGQGIRSTGGCSDCDAGFGGGLRGTKLGDGAKCGLGGRLGSHSSGCNCDTCTSSDRGSLFAGHGFGSGGGLFSGKGNCGCSADSQNTSTENCGTCNQGPAMPTSGDCGSSCIPCRKAHSINLGWGQSCGSKNCSCGSNVGRAGLFSGLGNCGCGCGHGSGLGLGSRSSCDCGGNASDCSNSGANCPDGCSAGSGHFHGFGLAHKHGCGLNNWDDMCGKKYFSASGGDCDSIK